MSVDHATLISWLTRLKLHPLFAGEVGEIKFMTDPRVGEVRLGCPDTLTATLLPPILERLSTQHPGIRLYVEQINPVLPDIRELRDRNLDLMFGRIGPPFGEEVQSEMLYRDRLVVVAPAQSKWVRRRKVDLADSLTRNGYCTRRIEFRASSSRKPFASMV